MKLHCNQYNTQPHSDKDQEVPYPHHCLLEVGHCPCFSHQFGGSAKKCVAAGAYHQHLMGQSLANVQELDYYQRKRIHNLKYYTWVEQQGKTYEEIQAQWYDPEYWTNIQKMADPIDELIEAFNARVEQ